MFLSSAIMTSCSLVYEHHYTEEDTALNCGSYVTMWAYLCAPTFQRNTMALYVLDGLDPAYNFTGCGVDTASFFRWRPWLQTNT
jgi:hypothetical protein